jgi:hypothetical protein
MSHSENASSDERNSTHDVMVLSTRINHRYIPTRS